MMCCFCKYPDSQVIDSRISEGGTVIRRRRRCPSCGARFTTYEKVAFNMPMVIKKDGRSRVSYNGEKLRRSMEVALRKRPVKATKIEEAIENIEQDLRMCGEKEVPSSRIGMMALEELKKLDGVAYVRFASVYLNYSKPEDFIEAVQKLNQPDETEEQ